MIALEKIPQHALVGLELIGTAAFAISGVISALRKNMDLVGICTCGFLVAFGGGTLRDVLIDRRPFFWAEHQSVLLGVLLLCLACAVVLKQHHFERSQRLLQIPDAIGLGLFCATGAHLSWNMGQPPMVIVLMGVITAAFGGVLRDIVCMEVPQLFNDHRPYAVCALAGGLGYLALDAAGAPTWATVGTCAVLTTLLRLLSIWLDVKLPAVRPH